MKIGDLVLDKTIDQMGIVTHLGYVVEYANNVREEYIVVELCDGSEILATEEELKLVVSSRLT